MHGVYTMIWAVGSCNHVLHCAKHLAHRNSVVASAGISIAFWQWTTNENCLKTEAISIKSRFKVIFGTLSLISAAGDCL